ncbi:T9SS type A sorting domain-containing protein [Kaistella flava (ex Peng et al. 2021)]|uniref:T9SS type A sorting domain-containing protein n=1 Tax=Kaistella flava (ex Peng et al. 2021) TaxID=2038776 RepID=A0A7M2YCZ1_9FLAO|nr:T9SS type A sorting domain-containing protein [Kaistella flava (ex Peng et al. 2021)]QOW11332.1 T9SS type A sorting domain-containing protein [Kaistella flava (ex Peng et al. 2021)]
MIKYQLLAYCFFANFLYSQTSIGAKAPNSYIYDLELANTSNYGGIEIPVLKAYEMWANYEYLKTNGSPTPIPAGVQTASLYWEDVTGLVEDVKIVSGSTPSGSKIKVEINKGRGKGNAVVAFKVNGKIYWSWHIWVTDNPENGVAYTQGFETDINGNLITVQYMDRNLGATSSSFLDNQWQKSGGLMYEWGRKDPFPPLVYKDSNFYEISGEVGVLKHKQIDPVNTIPVKVRPFNEIEKNIQYSVNNPITYIVNTDNEGSWFSNSRYKVAGVSPNYVTWDLWSDNAKGGNSNASSSDNNLKKESSSYELKSELDPCPNGWRIPSYYGRETMNNNLSIFGRKNSGVNDDVDVNSRQIFPNAINPRLDGIKVYPGLGMDFTNAQGGARNIDLMTISGGYVYYPNAVSPNAPVGVMFQDNAANGGIWSATFAFDGARVFSMISDPARTDTNVGLHAIFNNETNPTKAGNAVKCMRDPNVSQIGNFATQYFVSQKEDYRVGLDNPNSYVLVNERNVDIPVSKAFSVYNQYLSDHEMLAANNLKAKVLWTSNKNLITGVTLQTISADIRKSVIAVSTMAGETGNAVVSLHNGDINGPALWSWHIWATNDDPTAKAITYLTEAATPTSYNFVNPTATKLPPMITVFMDRNLGAESNSLESGKANGLHYQWGRKDPLPIFQEGSSKVIYTSSDTSGEDYLNLHTASYENYGSKNSRKHKKEIGNILYSVQNPLRFLYHSGTGKLYDGGNHYGNDLSKVKDWVSDERASADNRWGHGDKKSPFDPCPEGWRVPDVTLTNLYMGSKGNSPWYNGYQNDAYGKAGVIQDQWHDIANFYSGVVGNSGWKFENSVFPIGNFPKDGIRGELGENKITFERSGVWTASMADYNTGYALAMQFQGSKMQTGTGVYPQAAMSVRCAKDEKRLLGVPANQINTGTLSPDEVVVVPAKDKQVDLYPNPFKDEFNIKSKDAQFVELYDLSGRLLLKTRIENGNVRAGNLSNGMYIVKIIMKDLTFVTKKVIKQ